jgi:PAS domain S-box-containing protein
MIKVDLQKPFLNALGGVCVLVDAETNQVTFNANAQKQFGFAYDQVSLDTFNEMFLPSNQNLFEFIEQAEKEGEFSFNNLNIVCRDGRMVYFDLRITQLTNYKDVLVWLFSFTNINDVKSFEINLYESEQRYRDFINSSPEIIQSFDKTGKMLFCNAVWHEKLGYSVEDLQQLNLFDIINDSYKDHCSELFMNVLQGKTQRDVKVEFVCKNGDIIILEGNVVPLVRQEKFIATHAFFRDITEKVRIEKERDDNAKLLETIFDTLPICLYVKNLHGKYLRTNKIMSESYGVDVCGKTDTDVFQSEALVQDLATYDEQAIHHPGDLVLFEIDLYDAGEPKYYTCGKVMLNLEQSVGNLIFGYSLDISDIKINARKLDRSERLLNGILENSSDGIILLDITDDHSGQTTVEFSNKKGHEMLDAKSDCLVDELFSRLSAQQKSNIMAGERFSEDKNSLGVYLGDRNDRALVVQTDFIEIPDEGQRVLVTLKDETNERRLISELQQNLENNKVLLGELHHRVKNNLALIDSLMEFRKVKHGNNELFLSALEELQMRVKTVALAHQTVNTVNAQVLVNMGSYIRDMISYYRGLRIANRNIYFRSIERVDVNIDLRYAVPLGLIITELVSNSLKFAVTSKLEILIDLKRIENSFELNYSDNGCLKNEKTQSQDGEVLGSEMLFTFAKQLRGEYSLTHNDGLKFKLEFQMKHL